jgi:hypothetical protein
MAFIIRIRGLNKKIALKQRPAGHARHAVFISAPLLTDAYDRPASHQVTGRKRNISFKDSLKIACSADEMALLTPNRKQSATARNHARR